MITTAAFVGRSCGCRELWQSPYPAINDISQILRNVSCMFVSGMRKYYLVTLVIQSLCNIKDLFEIPRGHWDIVLTTHDQNRRMLLLVGDDVLEGLALGLDCSERVDAHFVDMLLHRG